MNDPQTNEVLEIERAAFAAWPAFETLRLAGWRLRFSAGQSQRANSVHPFAPAPPGPLDAAVAAVAAAYRARRLRPMIEITPAADPIDLDFHLAAAGWSRSRETHLMTAPSAAFSAGPNPSVDGSLALYTSFPPEFEAAFRAGSRSGEDADERLGSIRRLTTPALFAGVKGESGTVEAVGLAVATPPFTGIYGMRTAPPARRRGHATRILGALARFAAERDCPELYLQVDADNAPAIALYEKAGFRVRYSYWFRYPG